MEKNIYKFVWDHSKKGQFFVLFLTLFSFPILYFSLELPKIIVNEVLAKDNFPITLFGNEYSQISYLLMLSSAFLGLVFISGLFKYSINLYKGKLGERLLSNLRFLLFSRLMRFPFSRFKTLSSGEIVPIITAEVEPLGGFIGDAFALPIFQGGTLLVYLSFIFMQDFYLGLASIAFYPLQIILIPRLQKKVNGLAKKRVFRVRRLAYRVGETIQSINEVHGNDTSRFHLADIANKLLDIFEIRFELFKRKFFIKFLNNFINQLTPFFFYAIGGYFVIMDKISFGALVAVLAAYKDIAPPWKELLKYYQQKEDIRVKYAQILVRFEPENMMPKDWFTTKRKTKPITKDKIKLINANLNDDQNQPVLKNLNFEISLDKFFAITGDENSGKDYLAEILSRRRMVSSGALTLAQKDYVTIPESIFGRHISYIENQAPIFSGTIKENIIYGLQHDPISAPTHAKENINYYRKRQEEAKKAKNTLDDIEANWIDYETLPCNNMDELEDLILSILEGLSFSEDLYHFGLTSLIRDKIPANIITKLLKAREKIHHTLQGEVKNLVQPFNFDEYNDYATLGENLLFGSIIKKNFDGQLSQHPFVQDTLKACNLGDDLLEKGIELAKIMIDIFVDLSPGHEFFDKYSFIDFDELKEIPPLLEKIKKTGNKSLASNEVRIFQDLPFHLTPGKHRLGIIDEDFKKRVLQARHYFVKNLPPKYKDTIEFFDTEKYNSSLSVQDNILFGKVISTRAGAAQKISDLLTQTINDLNLKEDIKKIALNSWIGVAGSKLKIQQKQIVILARALIKHPDLLILNRALLVFDPAIRSKIGAYIFSFMKEKSIIQVITIPDNLTNFDQIIHMKEGQISQVGTLEELQKDNPDFQAYLKNYQRAA